MNPSQPFQPWVAPLGWLALEAALVVLAALAVQPLLRTAAARRSMWRAALLALIAVLALELTGTGSQLPAQLRLAWQTTFPAPVPPPDPPPALEELPFTPPPILSLAPTGGEGRGEGAFTAPEPLQLEPASPLPPPPRTLSHPPTFSPAPSPLPAFLWLTGLATLLARSAWTHAGFAWLRLRHFLPAAESLCERVQALAARLGLRRRVRVLASERLRAPAAFGWMRPGVGVPGDFTVRFAPAQQDVMLAHELAHLAARDPLWQLLADLAVAALWWHPLAWVARHQHRLAAELAADDASLALPDGPVVLAECLLVLGHEAAAAPRAPLGMAGFRSQLGRRVERLVALPRRDWSAPGPLRLALQTAVALLALAALALLPGCAANRAATEPPARLVAKWWQAKSKTSETQPRGATLLIQPQPKPALIQGRVSFNGTPPAERDIPIPKGMVKTVPLKPTSTLNISSLTSVTNGKTNTIHFETGVRFAVEQQLLMRSLIRDLPHEQTRGSAVPNTPTHMLVEFCRRHGLRHSEYTSPVVGYDDGQINFLGSKADSERFAKLLGDLLHPPLKTRLHRISPDGGLADVLVYVKAGLPNQTFPAPTNTHSIRIQGYEYQPYISAVQTGQPIRWETDVNLNFHPTPTNPANREFNRTLMPGRPVEATFTAPEFFLRTKDDVHPWLFGYVSILPHPFFAVTDAEGRFRFPQPLPPGKYTLAAVHRRAGEVVQELNLTEPLPAGARVTDVVFQFNAPPGSATPPPLISTPQLPAPPLAADFAPSKPPTREELLERKARVVADIKATEKVVGPAHPKMVGLRKQLESLEEALRQLPPLQPALPNAGMDDQTRRKYEATLAELEQRQLQQVEQLRREGKSPKNPGPGYIAYDHIIEELRKRLSTLPGGTNAIDISVGRQLFVDHFLIESNTLKRTWHEPSVVGSPQLTVKSTGPLRGEFPFPEAAWYDAASQEFRLRFALRTNSVLYHSPSSTNWSTTNGAFFRGYSITDAATSTQRPERASTDYESHRITLHRVFPLDDDPLSSGLYVSAERRGNAFSEPSARTFIPVPRPGDGSRWSDLHPLTNGFLVVGRDLRFYFGGRVQREGDTHPMPAVGLATLRRDGFASLDAGPEGGVLTTKAVTFRGRFLFVNLKTNAPDGELRMEILHPDGRPIVLTKNDTKEQFQPFSREKCIPLAADQTLMGVSWQNGMQDLSMLANRPVRFRFHLKNASLYSFWVGPGQLGRSMGRVAGGGPHFTNDVDTIGNRSYRPFPVVSTNAPAPKPGGGAVAPPAPVGDDVRSLTPTRNAKSGTRNEEASQRLVTSAATNADAANPSPQPAPLAPQRAREPDGAPPVPPAAEPLPVKARLARAAALMREVEQARQRLRQIQGAEPNLGEPKPDIHAEVRMFSKLADAMREIEAEARLLEVLNVRYRELNLEHDPPPPGRPAELRAILDKESTKIAGRLRQMLDAFNQLAGGLPAPKPAASAPPTSQSLVTSSPTPIQLAAAAPKGVTLPVPNPYYRTNSQVPFLTHSSKGAQRINRKLEEIVLPEVHFDAVPLVGVVQRLIEDAKKFDPEKQGLNFLINDVAPAAPLLDAAGNPVPVARPVALSEGLVRVTQPLKNLTLRQALDVICKTAELPTQFTVEEYAIAFIPRGPVAYYSRTFRVNPDTFIQGLQGVGSNPVLGATPGVGNAPGAAGQNQPTTTPAAPVRAKVPASVPATQRTTAEANALVRQFFQSAGVTALGATNGSTRVTFNPANGLLLVRGTTNDLRLIELAIQKVQPVGATVTNTVPQASPAARTNAPAQAPAHSSKGTQRNNAKLDEIILPEVRFDSVMLPEVVKWLDANVKQLDPESDPRRKGLNFLINNVVSDFISPDAGGTRAAPLLDPQGNPIPATPRAAPRPDLAGALVKLPVAVSNLTLRQALDAICKATVIKPVEGRGQGLKYSVEDYAIVFSPKLPEQAELFSRIFKVDPETFVRGLRGVTAGPIIAARTEQFRKAGGTNLTVELAELNVRMRDYLRSVGVSNLGPTNGPVGTQIYLNDQKGLLLVRASLEDLDIIQQAVELLNEKPAIKSPGAKRPQ